MIFMDIFKSSYLLNINNLVTVIFLIYLYFLMLMK